MRRCLMKITWCILKRKQNLTSQQRVRLRNLPRHELRTVLLYSRKENFCQFWGCDSPAWADKFLSEWCPWLVCRIHANPAWSGKDVVLAINAYATWGRDSM
jgi:hypothetical protein